MTLLKELQTLTTNTKIAEALNYNHAYITTAGKRELSKKLIKQLESLNFTDIKETEHFKITFTLEYKD